MALAALGINTAVFTTTFLVFNFLTYGTTAEVARLRGAGREQEAARYVFQALLLAIGCGILAAVALLGAAPWIVGAMGASGDVVDPTLSYLRIRAFAAVPVLVVAVGHGAFRGRKDTRTPLWITVAANGANAVLSYVLIHPAGMGVPGAAWGTVAAQTGAACAFLVLGARSFPQPDFRWDPQAMRRIARVSRDLFLRTAALLTALLVSTAVATRMGTVTVAAHQVARELWTLLALVLDGFAIAGQAMVGTALGRGEPDRARADAKALMVWGLLAGGVIGVGYLALVGPLPLVFSDDPAVLGAVREVWWVITLLQPIGGIVFVLDGVLMGAGDYRFLLGSTALAALGGLVPVAIMALRLDWGLPGIWAGMAVLMVVRLAATLSRLAGDRWLR